MQNKERKRRASFIQRRKLYNVILRKNLKEDVEKAFSKDVLENHDFKRHIKETAVKLGLDEKIVFEVVEHYFKSIVMFFKVYPKERIRVVIYSFFYLEIINPVYNNYSIYGIAQLKKRAKKNKYLLNLIKKLSK